MTPVSSSRLAAIALLSALAASSARGNLILVFPNGDDIDPNGNCTLREAVEAAQTDLAVDACPAGSAGEADVVQLAWGDYPLTLGEIHVGPGELIVRGAVTPPRSVVAADGAFRLFYMHPGAAVSFEGLDLASGEARDTGEQDTGGAVRSLDASLGLRDVEVRGNVAVAGGGLYFSAHGAQTLHVERSRIRDNRAAKETPVGQATGGGVYVALGGTATARFVDSEISANHAQSNQSGDPVYAGGLYASLTGEARLELERVELLGNRGWAGSASGAAYGAGAIALVNDQASLRIRDARFFQNLVPIGSAFSVTALQVQASIAAEVELQRIHFAENDSGQPYRGVYLSAFETAKIRATNLLVADGPASGLLAFSSGEAAVDLGHLTVTGHSATGLFLSCDEIAHLQLDNSIVWDNVTEVTQFGPVVAGPSNLIDVDPLFVDPLAGDWSLLPASSAIGHGDRTLVSVDRLDLAHAPRTAGTETDAGAYEFGSIFGDDFESGDAGAWSASAP